MEKKAYQVLELEIVVLTEQDIVVESFGDGAGFDIGGEGWFTDDGIEDGGIGW